MKITTIGIDMAKEVFQVRVCDNRGKAKKDKDFATIAINLEKQLIENQRSG